MSKLKGRKRGNLLRHVSVTQSGSVASSSFGGLLNHPPSETSAAASPPAMRSCVEVLSDAPKINDRHVKYNY